MKPVPLPSRICLLNRYHSHAVPVLTYSSVQCTHYTVQKKVGVAFDENRTRFVND